MGYVDRFSEAARGDIYSTDIATGGRAKWFSLDPAGFDIDPGV
jgi:hypothetical protein